MFCKFNMWPYSEGADWQLTFSTLPLNFLRLLDTHFQRQVSFDGNIKYLMIYMLSWWHQDEFFRPCAKKWQKDIFRIKITKTEWQCTVSPLRHHPNLYRNTFLLFGQIHFVIWTNIFCDLDKYILWFGQIHFSSSQVQFSKMENKELSFLREAGGGAPSAFWGTIGGNYILWFGQIHFSS